MNTRWLLVGLLIWCGESAAEAQEARPPLGCGYNQTPAHQPHADDTNSDADPDRCHGKQGDAGGCGFTGNNGSANLSCTSYTGGGGDTVTKCRVTINCGGQTVSSGCGSDSENVWVGKYTSGPSAGKIYWACSENVNGDPASFSTCP